MVHELGCIVNHVMNWKRGFFRLWVFLSVLWLALLGSIAWSEVSSRDYYQYIEQLKNYDWDKPFYGRAYAPKMGKYPDRFALVIGKHLGELDKEVDNGSKIQVEFPDSSYLYLSADLTNEDRNYLGELFWEGRWERYFKKIAPWFFAALGSPLVLLLLGVAVQWIFRGFAGQKQAS